MGDWDYAVEMGLEDLQGNLLVDDDYEPVNACPSRETIEIELTPSKYLDSNSRYLRAQLTNNNLQSDKITLELFHDKYNDNDPMAIEVFCDKIFIGYVRKKETEEDVDGFCFSKGPVLRKLTLEWKGTYFELAREMSPSYNSSELSKLSPYESKSIHKLWDWADQNDLTESEFPRNYDELTKLTTLKIEKEDLNSVPHEIGCLQNLVDLQIRSGSLKTVPSSIGSLRELNELWISGNNLRMLPSEIGTLENLTVLAVCGEKLTEIPPEIGRIKNLEKLIIVGTSIVSLPSEISNLSKIKTLAINQSQLDSTVDFSWLAELSNLENLSLTTNNLTFIPDEVFDLHKLKKLEICETKIAKIPGSIENLKYLVKLRISYNPELKTLPDSIDGLINLDSLEAFGTPLETLPESIINLTNVKWLRFSRRIEIPDWYWDWEEEHGINMITMY